MAFRYVPFRASYPPDAPYNSPRGRFNDGVRFTLYVSNSLRGATVEFYRRHSEFLSDQGIARIRVYTLTLDITGPCLDVRTPADAAAAGVVFDRLRSNEADESLRYADCHALADGVGTLACGIAYPSAAHADQMTWCLVLFGRPASATWWCSGYSELVVPTINPAEVRRLPT